ncbi:M20/M25/M40 family metallo-hydrolase [Microbacterium sp. RD1]|uniref:M20/M25/M40 family metallo-hydrolase n=1 Tax=Microbacterium sp. RD1 TaxID=3457313 RepID=UPI003FA52D84
MPEDLRLSERELLADLRTLVEVESPSDDPVALERSASVVAALGARVLGAEPERHVVDGVPHLEWDFGGAPRVLLLGHHDTVWPVGSWEPLWSDDGVHAHGPGAFDMKAGVVQILHAVAALDDRAGVRILITGDEELGSPTARPRITRLAAEAGVVLVTEASAPGGAVKTARSGVAQYAVEVVGRAAHAGLEPEKGVNATIEIASQIAAVGRIATRFPDATVTPTVLSAGTSANTVPATARLHVDVRARTTRSFDAVDAALSQLTPIDPRAQVSVHRLFASPPLEERSTAALFSLASVIAGELGLPPLRRAAVGGGSDGNIAGAAGALVLDGLGAVGGGAHARDEHVSIADLVPRTRLLSALVTAVCAGRLNEGAADD